MGVLIYKRKTVDYRLWMWKWRGGEQGIPRTLRARKSPMISLNPWYVIWTHSRRA
ncbi:hypothetical protein AWT69_002741 [Pseudomonas putida]|nr:hypothetical protein AWT69_002741 [Pseudomonas putida]